MRGDSGQKRGHEDDTPASVHKLVAGRADGGLRDKQFRPCANWRNRAIAAGIAARDDVPLGIGPAPAVPRTGIPMGATELSSPGVSPMTSPLGAAPGNITTCSSIGGSFSGTTGTSGSTTTFDGGGTIGNASGTCAGIASGPSAGPASSASSPTGMGLGSPVGRLGIPLGSTELGVGGLSPPPDVLSSTPSAPLSTFGTPCPTGTPAATAMSSGSC